MTVATNDVVWNSGLAVVFAEDTGSTATQRPPRKWNFLYPQECDLRRITESWSNLCPKYDSLTEEQKGGLV